MTISIRHDGKDYINFEVTQLLEEGIPQAAIDGYHTGLRVGEIKAECRRRIYSAASAETQMNMAAAAAVVSGKTASARTDAEKTVLAGAEQALGWVNAMRANIATLAADPDLDITDNANWPDCPADVLALVELF